MPSGSEARTTGSVTQPRSSRIPDTTTQPSCPCATAAGYSGFICTIGSPQQFSDQTAPARAGKVDSAGGAETQAKVTMALTNITWRILEISSLVCSRYVLQATQCSRPRYTES